MPSKSATTAKEPICIRNMIVNQLGTDLLYGFFVFGGTKLKNDIDHLFGHQSVSEKGVGIFQTLPELNLHKSFLL